MCAHRRGDVEAGGGELSWRIQCDVVQWKWKLAAETRVYRGVSFDARRGQLTRGQVSTYVGAWK